MPYIVDSRNSVERIAYSVKLSLECKAER